MSITRLSRPLLSAAIIVAALSGCQSPPPDNQLFDVPPQYQQLMTTSSTLPFEKAWCDFAALRRYDKIHIAATPSPIQLESTWWEKENIRYMVTTSSADLSQLSTCAAQAFSNAFAQNSTFVPAAAPGPRTLVLEFIIVQVVPNKPVLGSLNALSSLTPIGWLLMPAKLGMRASSPDAGGAIAMECILRDSQTGRIVAVFADRKKSEVALFNANDFTTFGAIHGIIDNWAVEFAKLLQQAHTGQPVDVPPGQTYAPIKL